MKFSVTAVESDCDGSYTYQTTIDIGFNGIDRDRLMFTVNGESFPIVNHSPIGGKYWGIGSDSLARLGKVLKNS